MVSSDTLKRASIQHGFRVATELNSDDHMEPDTIENCVRWAMALAVNYDSWQLRLKHKPSGDIVPIEAL